MSTIPSVQLFRNSRIIAGRTAAAAALENQKSFVADGGLILARYSIDGSENGVKTLLGIVRNGGGTNAQLTIIDVEGAAENVQSAITSAINSLNKGDAEVEGQYVTSVSETKGIITVTRKDLPSLNKTSDSGKAITAITQTKGLVNVEFGGVAAANVSVADTNNKFTATNVEDVLLEIQNSLDNAIGVGGSVGTQIANAIKALDSSATSTNNYFDVTVAQEDGKITSLTVTNKDIASAALLGTTSDTKDNATAFGYIAKEAAARTAALEALDLTQVGGNGQVITTISQSNGQVSASAIDLTASNVKATASTGSTSAVAVDGNTVSAQIESLATSIKSVSTAAKTYSITSITGEELTALGTNVKEAYKLVDEKGAKAGEIIKIYNDSSLKSVALDGQTLKFTYILANGSESTVGVDVSTFLAESEFSDGLEVVNHVVKVKKAEGSEGFLTVGESGVKLSGVQAAIDAAAASATTKVEKTGEGSHITVTSSKSNSDSSVTYTISESDIASEAALTAEVNDRQSADTTLQTNIDNVNSALTAHTANTVVHVTQEDKDKWNTPTDLSNYYTKSEVDEKDAAINSTIESYGHVTSQALNDLGTRMDDYGQVTSQALNDLGTKFGDYYTKTEVDEAIANVDVTSQLQNYYTKTEVDSKDATLQTALDALSSSTDTKIASETTERQNADNTLQGNINNVNSSLTAHTANTTVHVTQADKDKWNTPTDLSNYYTKAEVDAKDASINATIEAYGQVTSQSLNDLGTRLNDYGHVTSQSLNDLSTKFADYYTKSEVDSKDSTIQTALDALSGDTKTKIDAEVAARVSGDNALQTALDALDAHVSENEDIVSQSLNDLNNRIGNTYVKSYIDALEARIAELEAKFLNMENNGVQAGEY